MIKTNKDISNPQIPMLQPFQPFHPSPPGRRVRHTHPRPRIRDRTAGEPNVGSGGISPNLAG